MQIRPRALADLRKTAPPRWIVRSLFVEHSLNILWGPEGSKKSFLTFDLAFMLALGGSWLDYRIPEPQKVLYILSEGQYVAQQRLDAWEQTYGPVPDAFCEFVLRPVNLLDETHSEQLDELMRDRQIDFTIFDTLAANTEGMEENTSKDMGKVVSQLLKLRKRATLLVVHHATKGTEDHPPRIRGHSVLQGAADTILEVQSDADDSAGPIQVFNRKNRAGARVRFNRTSFQKVQLGKYQSSLVVRH